MASDTGDQSAGSKSTGDEAAESALLITSATAGVRDSGTGFCFRHHEDGASVITCAHVVSDLDPSQGNLRVNGHEARTITSADDRGIDLAILKVPELAVKPATLSSRIPNAGEFVFGRGYAHLHGGQYVSRPLFGMVKQVLTMRAQHSQSGVTSLKLIANEGTIFEPGNSGSAIFDNRREVVGVLVFASRDGREGYAICVSALNAILPGEVRLEGAVEVQADPSSVTTRPLPPELGPIGVWDDPNKNRFGKSANDGQVKISAIFRSKSGSSYFKFDVSVQPVRPELKLYAPARFYLHDTYPKPMVQITRQNSGHGFTLADVYSYGVYTIGCHVFASDGRWHQVEYDLAELPDLPAVFKDR